LRSRCPTVPCVIDTLMYDKELDIILLALDTYILYEKNNCMLLTFFHKGKNFLK
jgi:hypothetical protein